MVTAKEIQLEVLTAQQALIAEAERIVSGKDDNERHVSELEALGFTGSSSALTAKMVKSKELDELVKWYGFEYPGLKFIPSEAMVNVCQKYGLAIGHVGRFTGEVPAWALKQIAANKHHIETKEVLLSASGNWMQRDSNGDMMIWFEDSEGGNGQWLPCTGEQPSIKRSNLMIAAPIAEMGIHSNERVNEQGQIETIRNMDPIVCIDVKGGYIVLAAWGEEGQDPQVFNAPSN